jgi:hypothetical protein
MVWGKSRNSADASQSVYTKIKTLLESRVFFTCVVALFVLQAGWIAIKSGFPLAFDEGYHLGIIELHAKQWSPFFSGLPDSTAQFGALATDPSYLYHYVMSFPYRVLWGVTHNWFAVILGLRFLSIALFVAALIVFRHVLAYTGASRALVNLVILAFTLLPLQTFTAAQINYDNILFPLLGVALLCSLRFAERLSREKQFDARYLLGATVACLLSAQVKYTFIPLFVAIMGFNAVVAIRWWWQNRAGAFGAAVQSFMVASLRVRVALLALLVVSSGLFGLRYGYNMVTYGSPAPDCARVVNVESCMAYGAWARNYELAAAHTPAPSLAQKEEFAKIWVNIMGNQLFTVLNANKGGAEEAPARALVVGAKIVIVAGVLLILLQWQKFMRLGYAIGLFAAVCGIYMTALLLKNYADYTEFGIPIAVQGRYLLPVLLVAMALIAKAYTLTFQEIPRAKVALVVAAIVIGAQGGGIITYAKYADESWQWSSAMVLREPIETP